MFRFFVRFVQNSILCSKYTLMKSQEFLINKNINLYQLQKISKVICYSKIYLFSIVQINFFGHLALQWKKNCWLVIAEKSASKGHVYVFISEPSVQNLAKLKVLVTCKIMIWIRYNKLRKRWRIWRFRHVFFTYDVIDYTSTIVEQDNWSIFCWNFRRWYLKYFIWESSFIFY